MNNQSQEDFIGKSADKELINKIGNKLYNFVKKYKILLLIIILVLILSITIFNMIPVININNSKLINLNTVVKLEKDQIIKLKGTGVSVAIQRFIDDKCPKSGTCLGPDIIQAVTYELNINDKKYTIDSYSKTINHNYQILTVESDYKTYSKIKIVRIN